MNNWEELKKWVKDNRLNITPGEIVRVDTLLAKMAELNKPLEVPQEIFDWLERDKDCIGSDSLFTLINRLHDRLETPNKNARKFIIENKKELFEVLIGNRDYKLKEEPKYYVLNGDRTMLYQSIDGIAPSEGNLVSKIKNNTYYQFTKAEIEAYDPRYLPFMVPVKEVSE